MEFKDQLMRMEGSPKKKQKTRQKQKNLPALFYEYIPIPVTDGQVAPALWQTGCLKCVCFSINKGKSFTFARLKEKNSGSHSSEFSYAVSALLLRDAGGDS